MNGVRIDQVGTNCVDVKVVFLRGVDRRAEGTAIIQGCTKKGGAIESRGKGVGGVKVDNGRVATRKGNRKTGVVQGGAIEAILE